MTRLRPDIASGLRRACPTKKSRDPDGKVLPLSPRAPIRSGRELADAVFQHVNPVQAAVDLLGDGDKRIKAKILELLLAYKFGKPAQRVEASGPGGGPVRVVWDIPRPARERLEAEGKGKREKGKRKKEESS